jgi:hypothetical protein
MIATLLLSMALQAAPAAAQSPATRYTGIATTPDGAKVLYREEHVRYGPPGARRELVLYRCPDGQPFARKLIDDGNALAPDFQLHDARSGYREGVRVHDGRRQVFVHPVGAERTRSAPLPEVDTPVIDSGFDVFIRKHWQALAAGDSLKIDFLVPSHLKFMHFRIERHRDADAAARGITVFRLKLDRWFAFVLPHIDVGYFDKSRTLAWFRGLSNLRDVRGENLKVRLHYPPNLRGASVTPAALAAVRHADLDGQCTLH